MKQVTLQIEGMDCANCALGIEKRLHKLGYTNSSVSFLKHEAYVNIENNEEVENIISKINEIGYKAFLPNYNSDLDTHHHNHISIFLIISIVFTIPLFAMMFFHDFENIEYWQWALSTPVFFIGLKIFGISAWNSLETGIPNMDVLIVMGFIAAYFYSLYGIAVGQAHEYMFFETTASIITFVLLGNFIEHRSVNKTTEAVSALLKKQSQKVTVTNGKEKISKSIGEIKIGDIIFQTQGSMIAADGEVLEGELLIDESMISGESAMVRKLKGDKVWCGTIVQQGQTEIVANANGDKNYLAQLINLVNKTLKDKPRIQKLADKMAAWFVPIIVVCIIFTFIGNYFIFHNNITESIIRCIAVAVIACPCAMGLATPTAIMVGLGRASNNQILLKGADSFERLAQTDLVIFDKTGTITYKEMQVTNMQFFDNENQVLQALVSMESKSNHPIALSITKQFSNIANIPLLQFEEHTGKGLQATDSEGNIWKVGNNEWLNTNQSTHGQYVTKNNKLVMAFDMNSKIKENSFALIQYLKNLGIKSMLLSGDKESNVKKIATELEFSEYYYEKNPFEKLEIIKSNQRQHKICMIGDGINDAAALTQSHVGVSFSAASDIAIQAADIVLVGEDIGKWKTAHALAKATTATIKQNLFWAVAYNIVAIPVAAMGLLSPTFSAFVMTGSDVVVIGNSLRLGIKKLKT